MHSSHRLCLLVLLNLPAVVWAQEPAVFTPPQAYPASRYEAGWSKNPFTLKTAAPVNAQDSFARDLAIGAHYGAADNPTVVIVNTKTHERFLLRKDQPAAGGMRLKSARISPNRKECQAEIAFGAESAVLAYDTGYLSQMAAAETSRLAASKPTAPAIGKGPLVIPPIPLPAKSSAPSPGAVVTSQRFTPASTSRPSPRGDPAIQAPPERMRFAVPEAPNDR